MKGRAPNPSGTLMEDERFAVYYDDLSPVVVWRPMHLDMALRCLYDVEGRKRILVQDGDPDAPVPLTEAEMEREEEEAEMEAREGGD